MQLTCRARRRSSLDRHRRGPTAATRSYPNRAPALRPNDIDDFLIHATSKRRDTYRVSTRLGHEAELRAAELAASDKVGIDGLDGLHQESKQETARR